jgi:hypothetical protein
VSVHRVDMRRGAALGAALAAGVLVVLLGAHATPGGYHGTTRYVQPFIGPKVRHPVPQPSQDAIQRAHDHGGSPFMSIPMLLAVVVILIVVISVLSWTIGLPGRPKPRRARQRDAAAGRPEQAAEDLADQLAQAVDVGLDTLGEGPVADAVIRCWLAMRDAAIAAGVRPRRSDTPAEFVRRVLASSQVHPAPLRDLADLYREARFSVHPMTETHRTAARSALESVRADLQAGARA